VLRHLAELQSTSVDVLMENRHKRLRDYGVYSEG